MGFIKHFIKRNSVIFVFGFIIAVIFLIIILTEPKQNGKIPAGFRKVDESVFVEGEPKEPPKEQERMENKSVPQIASPENKGRPYFYGEHDPNLRDAQGYPIPPSIGSTKLPDYLSEAEINIWRQLENEIYQERLKSTTIIFTEKGFSPRDASACTGREIIWINKSEKEIKIVETTPKHQALKGGIVIQPNESFSFRPLRDGHFAYVEEYSNMYGTIMVSDVTRPLLEGVEEN